MQPVRPRALCSTRLERMGKMIMVATRSKSDHFPRKNQFPFLPFRAKYTALKSQQALILHQALLQPSLVARQSRKSTQNCHWNLSLQGFNTQSPTLVRGQKSYFDSSPVFDWPRGRTEPGICHRRSSTPSVASSATANRSKHRHNFAEVRAHQLFKRPFAFSANLGARTGTDGVYHTALRVSQASDTALRPLNPPARPITR
ncbi:hypothetical protein C8R47DRAFT_180144 [Mycena vitilis]|nr:hypothetical protein C8R47DRAFT_180144 [Mycena vitilis]